MSCTTSHDSLDKFTSHLQKKGSNSLLANFVMNNQVLTLGKGVLFEKWLLNCEWAFNISPPYQVSETDWRIWVSEKGSSHPWVQLSFSGGVLSLYSSDKLSLSVLILFFFQVSLTFTYILSFKCSHCFSPPYIPLFAPSVPSLYNLNGPSSPLNHFHWPLLSVFCKRSPLFFFF